MKAFFLIGNLLIGLCCCAQSVFTSVRTSSFYAGASALSTDSIPCRSLHLAYPVYEYYGDTLNQQVIISCRQPGDGTIDYLNKAGFASIGYDEDSLIWRNETSLYHLKAGGDVLLVSSDVRSVVFNRKLGYDINRIATRAIYMSSNGRYGLYYQNDSSDVLNCAELSSGVVLWTAVIPREEDWADVVELNDSTIIVAAGGLHALDLHKGLLWSHRVSTAVPVKGVLVYSPVLQSDISSCGAGIRTSRRQDNVRQLCSNILVRGRLIYFASRESLQVFDLEGKQLWQSDLRDYDPSRMQISITPQGLLLVSMGLGVHGENYVVRDQPFVLLMDTVTGSIADLAGLSEAGNLMDFMNTAKGMSFGGREAIVEISTAEGLHKTVIRLDVHQYGMFRNFIDGNEYYTAREGFYVPLNFIDDQLIYFGADNNKIYGISNDRLMYEYHFSELMRMFARIPEGRILAGLKETYILTRNSELMGTLQLADPKVLLKDKLYFFDKEKVRIVDLKNVR